MKPFTNHSPFSLIPFLLQWWMVVFIALWHNMVHLWDVLPPYLRQLNMSGTQQYFQPKMGRLVLQWLHLTSAALYVTNFGLSVTCTSHPITCVTTATEENVLKPYSCTLCKLCGHNPHVQQYYQPKMGRPVLLWLLIQCNMIYTWFESIFGRKLPCSMLSSRGLLTWWHIQASLKVLKRSNQSQCLIN